MKSSILMALGELLMDGDSTKSFDKSKIIGAAIAGATQAKLLAAIMHAKRCRIVFMPVVPYGKYLLLQRAIRSIAAPKLPLPRKSQG